GDNPTFDAGRNNRSRRGNRSGGSQLTINYIICNVHKFMLILIVILFLYCVTLMTLVTPLVVNVTFISNSGQVPFLCRAWRTILHSAAFGLGGLLVTANIARAETITNLEAAANT